MIIEMTKTVIEIDSRVHVLKVKTGNKNKSENTNIQTQLEHV